MFKKWRNRGVVEQATAAPGEKRTIPCNHRVERKGRTTRCILQAGHYGRHEG